MQFKKESSVLRLMVGSLEVMYDLITPVPSSPFAGQEFFCEPFGFLRFDKDVTMAEGYGFDFKNFTITEEAGIIEIRSEVVGMGSPKVGV